MKLTIHAKDRWELRCSHLDPTTELATARPITKRLRNMLRDPSWDPKSSTYHPREKLPQEKRYFITANGILLVVAYGNLVVTVIPVGQAKRRARERTRRIGLHERSDAYA